eukprot:2213679-Amphidinium_carterae.2
MDPNTHHRCAQQNLLLEHEGQRDQAQCMTDQASPLLSTGASQPAVAEDALRLSREMTREDADV